MKSLSRVQLFATPWTVAYQASLSMGFSRQEYWSGLPFPSPGDLPEPGIEPTSPALQADSLLLRFIKVISARKTIMVVFHSRLPCGSEVKAAASNAGDLGSIPGSGTYLAEGNGNPLQYSCLENSMERGTLWATVHGVSNSQTQLSNFHLDVCKVLHPAF